MSWSVTVRREALSGHVEIAEIGRACDQEHARLMHEFVRAPQSGGLLLLAQPTDVPPAPPAQPPAEPRTSSKRSDKSAATG